MTLRFPSLLVVLACAGGMACPKSNAASTTPVTPPSVPGATLAFTSSVRGWVEPCGCTVDPLGGVDRIRAELTRTRAKGPTVFFDTGGMLFDHAELAPASLCQEDARVKLLLQSARESGLQFTGLGAFDLAKGDAWRSQALAPAGISTVSANITGGTQVLTRLIKEVGGIKVGFTGSTWPAGAALPADGDSPLSWQGLALQNPIKAVAREAGLLRQEGAVVVVVLSQMARASSVKLASSVAGLDLVIQGHEPGEEPVAPQEVARGTWMISAGQNGQYLGKLTLHMPSLGQSCCLALDDGGAGARQEAERLRKRARQMEEQAADFESRKDIANAEARRKKAVDLKAQADTLAQAVTSAVKDANSFSFEALPLNSKVAPDPTMTTALHAYKASLKDINLACEKTLECAKAAPGKATYVGSQSCNKCHDTEYEFWQNAIIVDEARKAKYAAIPDHPNKEGFLGHARAWKTLEEKKATGDRDCIKCHAVGFEEPGGPCKVAEAALWGNVGCENCHGPGSIHAKTEEKKDIRRDVPESRCRECHLPPHIDGAESFVYNDKLKVILGKGHGEARWKILTGNK